MRPLCLLELRRGLRDPLAWSALAVFVLGLATLGGGPASRQALWALLLLLLLPWSALRAAGLLPAWRSGEADWLGSRPVARGGALVAAWGGVALAAAAWLALGALLVEARTDSTGDALRLRWSHDHPGITRLEPGQGARAELAAPATRAGDRLRVPLRLTVGVEWMTEARLSVARAGSGVEASATVSGRHWLEVEPPPGDGPLLVQVDNLGGGALAWMDAGHVELWSPASPSAGPLALWLRAVLLALVISAAAVGASAWMGAGAAAGAALCIVPLGPVLSAPAWWPGVDLGPALAALGEGRLPSWSGAGPLAAAAALAALGLLLARPGLASWRHGR